MLRATEAGAFNSEQINEFAMATTSSHFVSTFDYMEIETPMSNDSSDHQTLSEGGQSIN